MRGITTVDFHQSGGHLLKLSRQRSYKLFLQISRKEHDRLIYVQTPIFVTFGHLPFYNIRSSDLFASHFALFDVLLRCYELKIEA